MLTLWEVIYYTTRPSFWPLHKDGHFGVRIYKCGQNGHLKILGYVVFLIFTSRKCGPKFQSNNCFVKSMLNVDFLELVEMQFQAASNNCIVTLMCPI